MVPDPEPGPEPEPELEPETEPEPEAEPEPEPEPEPEAEPETEPEPETETETEPEPEPEPKPKALVLSDMAEDGDPPQVGESTGTSAAASLRNARLAAGLSVTRVAEETCLRAQFIEALETGQFDEDMLPLAFCRSYVKRLCELYCLPEQETVAAFVKEYEEHQNQSPRRTPRAFHVAPDGDDGSAKVAYVPREMATERTEGRSFTVGGVLAGIMVLVAVGLSITTVSILVLRHRSANRPAAQEAPAKPDEKGEAEPAAELPPVDVRQFILPELLPLDELPIPK